MIIANVVKSAEATTGGLVVAHAYLTNALFAAKNVTNVSGVATPVLYVVNVGREFVGIVGSVVILIVEIVIAFAKSVDN